MLSARSLTMQYPGVRALDGVDFDLGAGEIHALCGENGAGKSTLIKILSGGIPFGHYGGHVELTGFPTRFKGSADALRAGIRVIHQELALCPDFTLAENLFLGSERLRFGLLDQTRMDSETRTELEKLGLQDLDPQTRTGTLPVGIRQMVEIARALRGRDDTRGNTLPSPKVLILDEPTSALSIQEASRLEMTLRALRDSGLAILYISHRLDEVFRLADRITVLRNGETQGTIQRAPSGIPFHSDKIVALMVGSERKPTLPDAKSSGIVVPRVTNSLQSSESPLLSVRNWTVRSAQNPEKNVVENVSFDLRPGEILGLYGLMGAGRTELVESLCGLYPHRGQGQMTVAGNPVTPRDAGHAHRHGIALVCEDRRGHGIMPEKSVRDNLTYASLRKFCSGLPGMKWFLREESERRMAQTQVDGLRIKTPTLNFPIGNLSGGNQQKVMIGRALLTSPRILILDEPTRGIDVGAKSEIYALIERLAANGMSILLISSENGEVLNLSHRVLILHGGTVVADREAGTLNETEMLALASGGSR